MLEELCRLCLTNGAKLLVDASSIYKEKSYAEKVLFCTGIQICKDDEWPQNICSACIEQVIIACEIKEKSIESDNILRSNKLLDKEEVFDLPVTCVPTRVSTEIKPVRSHKTAKRKNRKSSKHSDSDFKCYICEKEFELIKTKNSHITEDHAAILRCHICDRSHKTSLAAEKHIKNHFVTDRTFLCSVCAATFYQKYSLDRHLAQLHGDSSPLYYCDLCSDWKTKFRTNIKRHMRTVHLNIKQHQCPFVTTCPDKFFTTKDTLNYHLVGRHDIVIIKCVNCSQKFDTEVDLQEHSESGRCVQRIVRKRTRAKISAGMEQSLVGFNCPVCNRFFEKRSQYSVHYHQKHKTSLDCKICGKNFSAYGNLLRHIQTIHESQKRFKCSVCNKSFSQKHSLENHLNIHTGAKPFACDSCEFKTGDRSTLAKHRSKHR